MWHFASKITQKLPAETAHNVAVKALSLGLGPKMHVPSLPVRLGNLSLRNPLGLAAGFDKNAEAYNGAHHLGFGFVEVGTITPLPQPGNPRPRVFRLTEDEAVINRYGFNGQGMIAAAKRLAKRDAKNGPIIGVNIGANKLTKDKPQDYYKTAHYLAHLADYVTVNISSPNTPGLRDLQDGEALKITLQATFDGLKEAGTDRPVFVKLAPDLSKTALLQSLEAATAFDISGVILTNTTITRPDYLTSPHRDEAGGLSGRPVAELSQQALASAIAYRGDSHKSLSLISVGGISSARDVYLRLILGADATQLYSALSLQGPDLPAHILTELDKMLSLEGGSAHGGNLSDVMASEPDLAKAIKRADSLYQAMLSSTDKAR